MEHKSGTDLFMLTEEFIASTLLVSLPQGSFANGYYSWLDGYVYCTHSCQKYYNLISLEEPASTNYDWGTLLRKEKKKINKKLHFELTYITHLYCLSEYLDFRKKKKKKILECIFLFWSENCTTKKMIV